MQPHLIAADRSGAGQRLRQGPDRIVPHGENADARLGDPGGRLGFRTNGELERLRDRLFPTAVEADVVAPPLPRARERERQSDPRAAGPDDPHDVGRQLSSARAPASVPRPGRGDPGESWRGAPTPARPAPGGLDRKSTRLNSSHGYISYAVFCL